MDRLRRDTLLGLVFFGSLAAAYVQTRIAQPAWIFVTVQGLFVATTLFGLSLGSARSIDEAARAVSGPPAALADVWFNARPILLVVGVPALVGSHDQSVTG